ncbi:ATP-binding protein [Candidatus Aerophobetes bacterium]|nr:ATP-binding protein [Candidatus Aerophobetes bacterium]
MAKLVKRKLMESLLDGLDKKYICILVGPRQVGKTTLLKMLIREIEKIGYKTVIYLNLDDATVRARFSRDPLELRREIERQTGKPLVRLKDKLFLIIDEAQKAPSIFEQVKIIYDEFADKAKIFLSGSSSMDIQRKMSETLAGRIRLYRMTGLSLGEVLKDAGFISLSSGIVADIVSDNFSIAKVKELQSGIWQQKDSVNTFTERMLLFGYLPAVYIEPEEEERWFILRDYISVYLEKDIRTLSQVGNVDQFQQVYSSLMFQNGGMLNVNNMANDLGMSRDTVRKYIDIMQSSFLIYKIKPYFRRLKARLTKAPKLYFFDQGIVNHTLRLTSIEALKSAQKLGTAVETLVLNELMSEGLNLALPPETSYLRDYQGHELDFVLKNKTTSIIEVTTSPGIEKNKWRSLNYFAEYFKTPNIFVVGNFEEFKEIKKEGKKLFTIPLWLWF